MWKKLTLVCLWAIGVVLGQMPYGYATPVAAQNDATELARLVRYASHIQSLPPEALRRERAQQEHAFAEHKSTENRLQVVLLSHLPNTRAQEHARAVELLQEYLDEEPAAPTAVRDFARFLLVSMTEKCQKSPSLAAKKARMTFYEKKLREERRTVKRLQKQIEDLKNIEKTLLERDGVDKSGT